MNELSNSERAMLTYKILKRRKYKKTKYVEDAILDVIITSYNRCLKLHRVIK